MWYDHRTSHRPVYHLQHVQNGIMSPWCREYCLCWSRSWWRCHCYDMRRDASIYSVSRTPCSDTSSCQNVCWDAVGTCKSAGTHHLVQARRRRMKRKSVANRIMYVCHDLDRTNAPHLQNSEEKPVGARERQDPPARHSEQNGGVCEKDGEGGGVRPDRAREVRAIFA